MNKRILSMVLTGAMLLTPVIALADAVADNTGVMTELKSGDTMDKNTGTIEVNHGTIDENYGQINKNYGVVDYNSNGDVMISENFGKVNQNAGIVSANSGVVDNINDFAYVGNNYEGGVVNGGRVINNYGGTVTGGATVDTEYYKLIVPENVGVGGANADTSIDDNVWIPAGDSEIIIFAKEGYAISSDIEVSGCNVEKTGDGHFILKNVSGPVTVSADVVKCVDYRVLEGDNQTFKGKGNLSFAVSGMKEKLKEIAIAPMVSEDDKVTVLDEGIDYSTANVDSSGYFTLHESYLKTLEKGEYHIYFTYTDGTATSTFTVAMPEYKVVYGDKSIYDKDSDGLVIGVEETGVSANRIRVIPVGCSNIEDSILVEGKDYQRIAGGFKDAKEGVTYYHIFDSYLKTLRNAEYVISFEYEDGNAYASFTVKANPYDDCDCNCTCHCNCELSPKTMDMGAVALFKNAVKLL